MSSGISGMRADRSVLTLSTVLAAAYMARCLPLSDCMSKVALLKLLPVLACVGVSAFIKTMDSDRSRQILSVMISLWALFEIILGMLQIMGITESGSPDFTVTGSFANPSPYCALLSGWGCMLVGVYESRPCTTLGKASLAIAVSVFIFVLSLACRGAILGAALGLVLVSGPERAMKILANQPLKWTLIAVMLTAALYYWKRPSADGRIQLYLLCIKAIGQSPLVGHGPGHFQSVLSEMQYEKFSSQISLEDGIPVLAPGLMPAIHKSQAMTYAFCDVLQLGVELGIAGMLVLSVLMVLTVRSLYSSSRPLVAMAANLCVTSLFSYTFQVWQIELLGALLLGQAMPSCRSECKQIRVVEYLVLFIAPMTVFLQRGIDLQRNWKDWQLERAMLDFKEYDSFARCALTHLDKLCFDRDFLMDYGTALSESGQICLGDSIFQFAYSKTGNPAFLVLLGDNCLREHHTASARELYYKAFIALPDRLLPLVDMTRTYAVEADSAHFHAMRNMAMDFPIHVETALTRQLRSELENMAMTSTE